MQEQTHRSRRSLFSRGIRTHGTILLVLALATLLRGQTTEGTITGTVRDTSGGVVPDVSIAVKNVARGTSRQTTTDKFGDYVVPALSPGTYQVSAEHKGFRRALVDKVIIEVNQTRRVDLTLEVGQVTQEIKVSAAAVNVDTDTSSLGQVIHSGSVTGLPLNGRNYIQLALLSTGTAQVPEGGLSSPATTRSNRRNTTVIINGNREGNGSWLVDGIETRNPWTGWADMEPSVDAIREFKIQTNSYAAEFGNGAAVVNIALKSGSNELHGSGFEFLRNDALDARNFFDGSKVPPLRMNQWGGSLGGPIVKNRTFIFGAYESLREHRSQTIRSRFPTAAERGGDLSSFTNPVVDPYTGSNYVCTLYHVMCPTPFTGNIIPTNRLSSIAQNIMSYWPLPNYTGDPVVNHVVTAQSINDSDQFQLKVDHRFSDKDQFFARYSLSFSRNANPGPAKYFGQIFPQRPQNGAIGYTHIFSPTWLNEFRLGYNRTVFSSMFEPAPSNLSAEMGLRNLGGLPSQAWGIPTITIGGYFTGPLAWMGPLTPNTSFYKSNTFQLVDHMTFIKGRHTIKAGLDLRKGQVYTVNGIQVNGLLTFMGTFYTNNSLGDFLMGLPFVGVGATGVAVPDWRQKQWSFFVQDDVRVTSRLTLNYGMRYDYSQPPVDARDNVGLFENGHLYYLKDVISQLPANLQSQAQVGGISRGIVEPDKNNFGPRFGFAYRPFTNDKTVLRGGFGVFYAGDPGGVSGRMNFSAQKPPFVNMLMLIGNALSPSLTLNNYLPDPATASAGTLVFFTDTRHNRDAYIQQWNFGIQQQLPLDAVFEIAYAGQVGHKLWKRHNENQGTPGPTNTQQARVPYPAFGEIVEVNNEANSNYNALQLRFDKRFSKDFSMLAAYTWSKSIDNASGTNDAVETLDRLHRNLDRGLSDFDMPQRLALSYVYELPFGKGKRFGSDVSGLPGKLASGWQLSGITTFASGTPFSIISGVQTGSYTMFGNNRPNRLCNGNLPAGQRTPQKWYDTSCFISQATGTFGNAGRNIVFADGTNVWDMSVMKNTTVSERVTIQFRAEFYNAFNHTNFARPTNNGAPTASSPNPAFAVITANRTMSGRSREIQFGLKVIF